MLQLGAGYPHTSPRTPVWATSLGEQGLRMGRLWPAHEPILHFSYSAFSHEAKAHIIRFSAGLDVA